MTPKKRFVVLAVLSAAMVGCGNSEGPDLVPVSGAVTLDGVPISEAEVVFHPQGSGGMSASAVTDNAGQYELLTLGNEGAVAGNYKVTVRMYQSDDPLLSGDPAETGMDPMQFEAAAANPNRPSDDLTGQFIPPKFSDVDKTTLTATVPDGGIDGLNIAVTTN